MKRLEQAMAPLSENLEQCLGHSIELYQAVLRQMQAIAVAVESNDASLTEQVQQFVQLQEQAQTYDPQVLALLQQAGAAEEKSPLVVQRLELINEVLKLNHLLLPKINGMMALVSHELLELKANRTALGGYKPVTHKQGRIVKSSA